MTGKIMDGQQGAILDAIGFIKFGFSIGVSQQNSPDSSLVEGGLHFTGSDFLATLLTLLIPVLYLGLIAYFTNGYTLGRRIMKIRIVATNHEHYRFGIPLNVPWDIMRLH
jgi:uncharacterized RDD family membrane protein YckC